MNAIQIESKARQTLDLSLVAKFEVLHVSLLTVISFVFRSINSSHYGVASPLGMTMRGEFWHHLILGS